MKYKNLHITFCPDCDGNKGGYCCQVYNDECCNEKIDCFCIRPEDYKSDESIEDVAQKYIDEHFGTGNKKYDPYVCDECGSQNIQTQAWVNPNTHEYIGTTEEDRDDNWCDECEEHNYFCLKSEFEERMQTWWGETDFTAMERITGYRQDDFSPEDGYQEFVDVCNDWWHKKSYDERRAVWNEYHERL